MKWTFQEGRFSLDIKNFTVELSEYEGIPAYRIHSSLVILKQETQNVTQVCVTNEDKDWMDG